MGFRDLFRRQHLQLSEELRDLLSKDKRRDDYGWSDRVDKLLDQGADPNVIDANGRPALCVVAEHGYPRTVEHFLALGADVNASSADGPPLRIAASLGRDVIVDQLLAHQGLRREDALEAVQSALQRGRVNVATRLLKFLDTLKCERYRHISALQVGATLAVVIESGSYCVSILSVVKSFMSDTLEWTMTKEADVRHRWDHHVQDRTYMFTIRRRGEEDTVVGHFMQQVYSSDSGMGSERSENRGGVLCIYLNNRSAAEVAAQFVGLVRAIDKKTND